MASARVRERDEEEGKLHAPLAACNDDGVLPTDVLHEVLLRLPANMLCRLRLVCRSWRSLTSDPIFGKAHASRHVLLAGVHVGSHILDFEVCVVDLTGNIIRRAHVGQPCSAVNAHLDLVCVSSLHTRYPSSTVLDFATGEVTALLPCTHGADTYLSPLLLGHVPSTGELKVLNPHKCATRDDGGMAVQDCCIATLGGGGGWRATASPPAIVTLSYTDRVAIGGVAYFLLHKDYSTHGNMEPDAIAVFDLAKEEWRSAVLQGPLSSSLAGDDDGTKKLVYHHQRRKLHLVTLDGCLVTVHHQDYGSMDLWFLVVDMMEVDKGLWTKRFSIQCAPPSHPYALDTSCPLLLLDDGRIVIWEERAHVLRVYDPKTSKWADLAILKHYYSMHIYQGNLLCPRLQR